MEKARITEKNLLTPLEARRLERNKHIVREFRRMIGNGVTKRWRVLAALGRKYDMSAMGIYKIVREEINNA